MSQPQSKAVAAAAAAPHVLTHGYAFEKFWKEQFGADKELSQPRVVASSDALARPGYSHISATEYLDKDDVLSAKIDFLIHQMIKNAEVKIAYNGAGISSSRIGDYASKASGSLVKASDNGNRLNAEPTHAHRVEVAMLKKGYFTGILSQNHDNLELKSGATLENTNYIHGRWSDKFNPVIDMGGTLRKDLVEWLMRWAETADVVFACGTSLSGMTADTCAEQTARRHMSEGKGQGLAILSLQETKMDRVAALRIYARIEDVFDELQKRLKLKIDTTTHPVPLGKMPRRH